MFFLSRKPSCARHYRSRSQRPKHAAAAAAAAADRKSAQRHIKPAPITPRPAPLKLGLVQNEASLEQVPASWHSLLAGITSAYQCTAGRDLVGVYLRGSLPRGCFCPSISDVDTFALILPSSSSSSSSTTITSSSSSSSNHSSSNVTTDAAAAAPPITRVQQLQQQVQQQVQPLLAGHTHLGFVKVEIKVLEVPAHTAAADTLRHNLATNQAEAFAPTAATSAHNLQCLQHYNSSGSSITMDANSSSSSGGGGGGGSSPSHAKAAAHTAADLSAPLTPSISSQIPAAFQLKTQSVCLAGLDLPQLLPAAAALPSHRQPEQLLLPGLAEDVAAARESAEEAKRLGELQQQVTACRWCLKRMLRASFELVQASANVWTQDLYWCCQFAAGQLPQLQPQLQQALEHYLLLQSGLQQLEEQQLQPQQSLHQAAIADMLQQQQQSLPDEHQPPAPTAAAAADVESVRSEVASHLAESWQLVEKLLSSVETQFLRQMLTEEPGWLTKHQGRPVPNFQSPTAGSGSSSSVTDRMTDTTKQQQQQQGSHVPGSWWDVAREKLLQLTAASAAEHPKLLMGAAPPAVNIPVLGSVASFDSCNAAAGAAAVRAALLGTLPAMEAATQKGCQDSQHPHLAYRYFSQPVVLKGAAAGWPAVQEPWQLSWLSQQEGLRGRVRVAPSLQFPFVEPLLADMLLQLRGAAACPSLEVDMTAAEFVARLQPNSPLRPVAFRGAEYCYMQAELPAQLQQEQLLLGELLQTVAAADTATGWVTTNGGGAIAGAADDGGCSCDGRPDAFEATDCCHRQQSEQSGQSQQQAQLQLQLSQAPRAWISPAGAVSPLHFDTSHSFLVQARGLKRMLFFSPDQLHQLYCYPDTHLLRRRSRVNVCEPDFEKFPLFRGVGALEALLEPGDVVFFPSSWAHYTESLGGSTAISAAAAATGGVGELSESVCGYSVSITFRMSMKL